MFCKNLTVDRDTMVSRVRAVRKEKILHFSECIFMNRIR
jgi:hypothetical protein